jgi:type I restriction enzyme, S subunit
MSEWKEYKLSDFAEIQTGPFGSQLHASDYVEIGTPCVMPTNIGNRLNIETNEIVRVSAPDLLRLKKYTVLNGDIVYSRRGDVEKCAFISDRESGWLCGTGCLRIRIQAGDLSPKFCAYYLSTPEIKSWVTNNAVGTTMPNLNSTILGRLPLRIPQINLQKSIAEVLSSLDDKIDLLQRQNKTLEAMAETLFREWFVEGVEESWESKKIKDVCLTISKGTTPTTMGRSFKNVGINFIKAESLTDVGGFLPEKFAFIDEETDELLKRSRIQKGDVLITIAGTVGRIAYVTDEILPANTNQAIGFMRANQELVDPYFIYCLFKTDFIKSDFDGRIVHAVQPNLSLREIGDIEFRMPPKPIMNRGIKAIEPLFIKKEKNTSQIQAIKQLRDNLLPRLMNGGIDFL